MPTAPPSKPERRERVQTLLRELADALAEDSSGETTKQFQEWLKADDRRRRERYEQQVQAALADLAKHIFILKQVTQGDPARQKAVSEFDDGFHVLKKRLAGRAVDNRPAEGAAAPNDLRYSAGFGARRFDFGTGLDQPAADPAAPNYTWTYTKADQPVLGTVVTVNGRIVNIKLAGESRPAVGQALAAVRLGDDPHYIGKVTITAVKEKEAVGSVSDLAWQQTIRVGDHLMVELQIK